MSNTSKKSINELSFLATEVMTESGLFAEFSSLVNKQLQEIHSIDFSLKANQQGLVDLTALAWCSLDNDDSLDLDQLTVSETLLDGRFKIYVAIADVDVYIKKNSAIDLHAKHNTTSVYSSIKIFPMLPTALSNDLTSLNENQV